MGLLQAAATGIPGREGNLVGPLQIQLLEMCTEAHPGWDNLSGDRDAELRRFAPAVGVVSTVRASVRAGLWGPATSAPPPGRRRRACQRKGAERWATAWVAESAARLDFLSRILLTGFRAHVRVRRQRNHLCGRAARV